MLRIMYLFSYVNIITYLLFMRVSFHRVHLFRVQCPQIINLCFLQPQTCTHLGYNPSHPSGLCGHLITPLICEVLKLSLAVLYKYPNCAGCFMSGPYKLSHFGRKNASWVNSSPRLVWRGASGAATWLVNSERGPSSLWGFVFLGWWS